MTARWDPDELCGGCPGQVLAPGEFDVAEKPDSRVHLFVKSLGDGRVGGRVLLADQAVRVCVHPWRVRLPVGAYASQGLPVPAVAILAPPTEVEHLRAWLTATLRLAGSRGLDSALDEAQTVAFERFPRGAVVDALRDVLGRELA